MVKKSVGSDASCSWQSKTHAIITAEVSPESIVDNEVLAPYFNPVRRHSELVSAYGAYDTKDCHRPLRSKGIKP